MGLFTQACFFAAAICRELVSVQWESCLVGIERGDWKLEVDFSCVKSTLSIFVISNNYCKLFLILV